VTAVGAYFAWQGGYLRSTPTASSDAVSQQVKRSDLVVTVTEDGNLESSSNLDVKCEVAGGSTILWLIKDGTHVNQGEELVRLDSSLIEEQVNTQKIAYERVQATRIEAERLYSAAKISVQEFLEGTYSQQLQICEANITIALENLRAAENSFHYTERMARKGYVPSLQRDSQAFAVERAKLDLATARTAKTVLEKFTRAKTLEDLESKRDTAEAKMHAEEAAFALEEGKLKRLTGLLEKCTIEAPRDGMVIYANETSNRPGAQSVTIEEGAAVRERQSVLRLPDLDHMQVKVLVHESKVEKLRPGMRARIHIQDADYQGTVSTIANQAEPSSFWAAAVKEFATIVKIDDDEIPHDGIRQLKPGMTASVEILVADRKDVLSVPIEAVLEQGEKAFCWIKSGGGVERREVQLGLNNTTMIEVKSGLVENDVVLLNPRRFAGDLATEFKNEGTIDVKERYGEQPKGPQIGPGAGGPGPGRGSGPGAGGPQASSESGGKSAGKSGGGRGNLMQYDANKDGKVSREEAPERVAQFFDNIDQNHDGFIDAKEAAAAAAARKKREAEGGGPPAG
jgi:multidrug efflux pump subunit AcrA (membrane-fusion protein)